MITTVPEIEIIEKFTDRLEGLKKFVRENQEVLRAQRHLDEDSSERAYWHAGYASALADVLNLLSGTRKSTN
jgi:hypothetical protein